MIVSSHRALRSLVASCILAQWVAASAWAGDEDIFSASVPPNVLMLVDSSGSMNLLVEHASMVKSDHPFPGNCDVVPDSFPEGTDNSYPDDDGKFVRMKHNSNGFMRIEVRSTDHADFIYTSDPNDHPDTGYIERTWCGRTRRLYQDGENFADGARTPIDEEYFEWLYTLDETSADLWGGPGEEKTATQILAEVYAYDSGRRFIDGGYYGKYHMSRIHAVRQLIGEVIYETNSDCAAYLGDCGSYEDRVRFGIAQFASGNHGGWVRAEIDKYSVNKSDLENAITLLEGNGSTPLGESLFKLYTYFMSRGSSSDRPYGKDGSTRFPKYKYKLSNGKYSSDSTTWPSDPVTESCQKNFIIVLSDGIPKSDDFKTDGNETLGFGDFDDDLIGDYAPDLAGALDIGTDSTPEYGPPFSAAGKRGAGFLDDIALFMQDTDCRLDYPDAFNTVGVYTVGFGTGPVTNALLEHTAENGNGLYFTGSQADAIAEALVRSIQDIFSKSQSFSAATVPAARTTDGGEIYSSVFQPSPTRPFWPGSLKSYNITEEGNILDKNGGCALEGSSDPTDCKSGVFKDEDVAPPHWNAMDAIPVPNNRNLTYSDNIAGLQFETAFTHGNLNASKLGLGTASLSSYPPDAAVAAASDLDEAVAAFLAGCEWGSGMTSDMTDDFVGCVARTRNAGGTLRADRLGDMFHSTPVVVGPPNDYIQEASYATFAADTTYAQRQRVIFAGANDGFFHGFNAGTYDGGTDSYGPGDGAEVFGFMPWGARINAEQVARSGSSHPILVDGSPSASDVWIDSNSDPEDDKHASEWKTVVVSGLREGGENYFALDVTNPAATGYPGYLWEFPIETDAAARAYVGQTWSKPIITRVRLKRSDSKAVEQWVAIFGFGYDDTSDPNHSSYNITSTKGRGIAMVDIATGALVAVRKFGIATGDVPSMLYALPARPTVLDVDQDGFADLIYIGDLGGNIWKWVIRDRGIYAPSAAELYQPNWSFRKFFSEDPTRIAGHRRSLFHSPGATLIRGVLHLAVGTGERANLNCSSTLDGCTLRNRYYVLKDRDRYDSGILSTIDGRESPTGDLTDVTSYEDQCPAVQPEGYFFEVADGEKFVTNTEVFNSFFFSSTYTPDVSNACEPVGKSTLYGLLAKCGQGFFGPPSSYSPEAGVDRTIDLGDGFSSDATISIAPGGGGNRIIISKQAGEIVNLDVGKSASEHGMLYWSETD